MQYLKLLFKNENISYYEIKGDYEGHLRRYIFSTAETRKICNQPEVLGCEYTELLELGVARGIKYFPEKNVIASIPDTSISVLTFLRGGLNFGLRNALHRAFGFNKHTSSYMTSQRDRDKKGRWFIRDDQYRKFKVPHDATLFIGDIVATGVTIANGLDIILKHAKKNNTPIRKIFFFTIGCHKVEKVLEDFAAKCREAFGGECKPYVVYIEGKFKLADSKTKLKINIPGTDLLRYPALLTPEFELSQYDGVSFLLERCTIYDGGSRSFDVAEYNGDLRDYWGKVNELAKKDFTLFNALKERWPETEFEKSDEEFLKLKKEQWHNVDDKLILKIKQAYKKRWTEDFLRKSKTRQALATLCENRLKLFQ